MIAHDKNVNIHIMDRNITSLHKMSDQLNDDFVPGAPADRIMLVWSLTKEIISLNRKYDAERRLQRHVTRLISRES